MSDDGCGLFGCVSQPQPRTEPKPDGCPPSVSFTTPGSGTVVDVRDVLEPHWLELLPGWLR